MTCAIRLASPILDHIVGPQDLFTPVTNLDRYGFSYVLARYAGLRRPRRPFCSWVHGWLWWDDMLQPEDFVGPRPTSRDLSIVVGSTRELQVLQADGYNNVVLGGLPDVYLPSQRVQRSRDTLLAFIAHSAESERFDVLHAEYLDYLASMRKDFEQIYVSIFALDASETLKSEITRRGLRVLIGANPTDKNSMLRTRRALEYVDHVSTNTMGSHIAYALAAGCKTSIWSPIYKYDYSVLANSVHGFSRSYVERMQHVHSEAYLKQRFAHLFKSHAVDAYANQALGLDMVGASHRLDEQAVLQALGWTFREQLRGYASGAARRVHRRMRDIAVASKKPTYGRTPR